MHRSFVFASSNRGKQREVVQIANQYNLTVIDPLLIVDKYGNAPEVEEDGETYADNAQRKANAYYRWSQLPSLADDTGLEVHALSGAPGVRSARYAGEGAPAQANRDKLLHELATASDRTARFVCHLTFKIADDQYLNASAILEGEIGIEPKGAGGFGYDSIFYLPQLGLTLSEAKEQGVDVETHRIKALKQIFSHLSSLKV